MIAAVAAGLTVKAVADRYDRRSWWWALFSSGVLLAPLLAVSGAVLGLAVNRFRRAAALTRRHMAVEVECIDVAELVAVGLAGGQSIAAAHRLALDHVSADARPVLEGLLDRIDRMGTTPALLTDPSALRGSSRVLATAATTGAPALPMLEAFVETEAHKRHAADLEALQRLPIRLMVPLALLVLPGFVLMTVGPAVVDSLARLVP